MLFAFPACGGSFVLWRCRDFNSFLGDSTGFHQVVLFQAAFREDQISMTLLYQVPPIQRAMMARNRGQSTLTRNQKRKMSVRIAIVGAKYRRYWLGLKNLQPRVAYGETFAQ